MIPFDIGFIPYRARSHALDTRSSSHPPTFSSSHLRTIFRPHAYTCLNALTPVTIFGNKDFLQMPKARRGRCAAGHPFRCSINHHTGVKQMHTTIGSVLVVGGGITGMQSALDLADSGYFVYLVEETPAIGGAMAQLDKTFPTNDCSM